MGRSIFAGRFVMERWEIAIIGAGAAGLMAAQAAAKAQRAQGRPAPSRGRSCWPRATAAAT